MIRAQRFGLALTLAAGLAVAGCGKIPSQLALGWMTTFAPAPKLQMHPAHRHKTRVQRRARATDPDITGSAPVAAKAGPAESAVLACSRRLYLQTATSTEEVRKAEDDCKQLIVNQPFGAGAD